MAWANSYKTDVAAIEKPLRKVAADIDRNELNYLTDLYHCFHHCTGKLTQQEFDDFHRQLPGIIKLYRRVLALWMPDHFLSQSIKGRTPGLDLLAFSQFRTIQYSDAVERDEINQIVVDDRMALRHILFRDARIATAIRTNTDSDARQAGWDYMRSNETKAREYYFSILEQLLRIYPFLIHLTDPNPNDTDIKQAIADCVPPLQRALASLPTVAIEELIYYDEPVTRLAQLHPELVPAILRVRKSVGPLEFTAEGWVKDLWETGIGWPFLFCMGTLILQKEAPVLIPACVTFNLFMTTRSLVQNWQQRTRDLDAFQSGMVRYQDTIKMLQKIMSSSFMNVAFIVPTTYSAGRILSTFRWSEAVSVNAAVSTLKRPDPYLLAVRKRVTELVIDNMKHAGPIHAGFYSKIALGVAAGAGSSYARAAVETGDGHSIDLSQALVTWGQIVREQDDGTAPHMEFVSNETSKSAP